tara:strand:+ start:14957 stop:15181 length:225 start_codon:yes stop_codon:yes gene_type:complete
MAPDSIFGIDLSQCCHAHDAAYTVQIDKNTADADLMKCIYESSDGILAIPSLVVAFVFFSAVSFFGSRFYNKRK